jgi:hypothetical protein
MIPMRPNASLDPPVEFVEERSDVGTFVISAPIPAKLDLVAQSDPWFSRARIAW